MIVLKSYSDIKTRQLVQKLKFSNGQKLTVFGGLDFDTRQMYSLGKYGVQLMVDRAEKGIGSNDQAFPPLKKGYAIRKTRAGHGNRRNLRFTGAMLGNISVRSVSATQARIDITSAKQRLKARENERKAPWWGWSPRDLVKLTVAVRTLYGLNVSQIGVASRSNQKPIWLDPNGMHATSGRLAA